MINKYINHKILSMNYSNIGTRPHKHTDYAKLKLHNLKWAANRLEMDEDSSTERKTWQVYSFGKINVLRLHLNQSR